MPFQPPRSPSTPARRRALVVLAAGTVVAGALGARVELLRLAATVRVTVWEEGRFLGRDGLTLQRGWHDCGPAALATLLELGGHPPVALDSIGRLAGTTLAGTTAAGLITAGRQLGLPLAFQRLPTIPLPDSGYFIAWVRSRHFVVARALPDGRVLVLDPQVGRYLLARDRFQGIWSGESLVAVAATQATHPPSGPDSLARILATGRLP